MNACAESGICCFEALEARVLLSSTPVVSLNLGDIAAAQAAMTAVEVAAVQTRFRSTGLTLLSIVRDCLGVTVPTRSAGLAVADSAASASLTLTSSGFSNGGKISGTDYLFHSPTLTWSNAPAGTQSFAIIVDTPCPIFQPFVQWVAYNIPASATSLRSDSLPGGATQGKNSIGLPAWIGPLPPPGTVHTYYFRLYALDANLNLPGGMTRAELLQSISGHVLGSTVISATCGQSGSSLDGLISLIRKFF